MPEHSSKYSALIIAIFVIGLMLIASFFSAFNRPNAYINDLLMRHAPKTDVSSKLMIVEANRRYGDKGDEIWLPVLKSLLEQDVKQVVFNFLPSRVSEDFYQMATDSGKVVFARRFVSMTSELDRKMLQPLPEAAKDKPLTIGLIKELTVQSGVYRRQYAIIKVDRQVFPSLELASAQQVLKGSVSLPDSDYRVNFSGGLSRLPVINIERVLAKGLVRELLQGRTVLVGVHDLETVSRYFTPISWKEGLVSAVFFHGFAVDTLLSGRQLRQTATLTNWCLVIMVITSSLFAFQWLSFQFSLLATFTTSLIYLGLCWLLLHQFHLLMAPGEFLLSLWLSFMLVWRYRLVQEKHFMDNMLFELSLKLQEKVFPVSFYHSESPWEQLIAMLNQTLDFNRLIFLERVPKDHRVKEIVAFNCQLDDINEKRRDYERTPYSIAINENRAILLKHSYFKKTAVNEEEYLAPLIFAGEVLGFWAFTIDVSKATRNPKFARLIEAYMQQISEILHYRNEWKKHLQTEKNKFLSYLRVEGGSESYKMINQSVNLMDRRISELQEVFNSVSGSSILYDLFGRVLLVNKRMEELGKEIGIRPYMLGMREFICQISGFDTVKVQHLLQQTIFDREAISLQVSDIGESSSYMLHIKPLLAGQQGLENFAGETRVFQMIGVLCELIDVTEMKKMAALREQMLERFCYQMRNDFAAIMFALNLMKDESLDAAGKRDILDSIQGKVDESMDTLEMVKEQKSKEMRHILGNIFECYPVDAHFSLERAIEKHSAGIKVKNIQFSKQVPKLMSLVFASPTELENVFSILLAEMLADTYQSGKLVLKVEEKDGRFHFCLHNTGIGMPDDKLQQFAGIENLEAEDPELLALKHTLDCVKQWGGSLELSSRIGEGSKIELYLRCFM